MTERGWKRLIRGAVVFFGIAGVFIGIYIVAAGRRGCS